MQGLAHGCGEILVSWDRHETKMAATDVGSGFRGDHRDEHAPGAAGGSSFFTGGRGSGALSRRALETVGHSVDAGDQRLRRRGVYGGGASLPRRQPGAVGLSEKRVARRTPARQLPGVPDRVARQTPSAGSFERGSRRYGEAMGCRRRLLRPVTRPVPGGPCRERAAVSVRRLQPRQSGLRRRVPATPAASFNRASTGTVRWWGCRPDSSTT